MMTFKDGPAAGVVLRIRRAPVLLRVVKNRHLFDALDQPDDVAEPSEQIFLYVLEAMPFNVHLCIRGKGKGGSGWYKSGSYRHLPEQPADEILRDNDRYRAWCDANRERLVPAWATGSAA